MAVLDARVLIKPVAARIPGGVQVSAVHAHEVPIHAGDAADLRAVSPDVNARAVIVIPLGGEASLFPEDPLEGDGGSALG